MIGFEVIILPTTNPKIVEPRMPSVTYVTNHFAQTVAVDTAHLGGTSYITVTSEDQSAINVYELTILPEPSHNAELNGLLLDGQLIPIMSRPWRRNFSASSSSSETITAISTVFI